MPAEVTCVKEHVSQRHMEFVRVCVRDAHEASPAWSWMAWKKGQVVAVMDYSPTKWRMLWRLLRVGEWCRLGSGRHGWEYELLDSAVAQ